MAGEAEEASPSSWTDRSKICDEAGDGIPGDDELRLRDGDAGAPYGCGIVCVIGALTPLIGDTERIVFAEAVVAVVGGILVEGVSLVFLALSSSFFLPKPQNLRLPALPSSSGAAPTSDALFKPSPKSGTEEVRDPVSSPLSLLRLIRLSAIMPSGLEALLQLHGWTRSDCRRKDLIRIPISPTVNVPKHKNAYLKQGGEASGGGNDTPFSFGLVCGLGGFKMCFLSETCAIRLTVGLSDVADV